MNRFLRVLIVACLGIFPLSHSVSAQVENHLGPLAGAVTMGQDGSWEGRVEGGWFNLFNSNDPGAVRYYHMDIAKLTAGERVVNLNTALVAAGSDIVYSGLLLDWISDTEYFGFTIGSDGSLTIIQRTAEGFEFTPAEDDRARLDGSDVLELRETPTTAALYANGEEIFTIEFAEGFSPSYGIIAVGTGRFAFNGFSIVDQGGATPFPPPGGGDGAETGPIFPNPGGGGDNPVPPVIPGGGGVPPVVPGEGTPPVVPGGGGGGNAPASAEDLYIGKVLMGTTFGVFFHEFAHALIGETGLPATGPEEDTADGFSAILLASMTEEGDVANEQERDFLEGMAEFASLYWYYSGLQSQNRTSSPGAWQDEHAPDLNRFRNMFCLIYGSNPNRYEDIAAKVNLSDRTKSRCQTDYKVRYEAWEKILVTVARDLGPDLPGEFPVNAPGGKISVVFQPSQLPEGKAIKDLMDRSNVMVEMLDFLSQVFVFPRDLKVEFRDCQEINAWYDPQAGAITMCYSLIQATTQLVLQSEQRAGGGGGGVTPPPVSPGGNTTGDAAAFLAGTWEAKFPINGQDYAAVVSYTADGQYLSLSDSPYGRIEVSGTWTASSGGANTIRIDATPVQWSPQQLCDNAGNCQQNQQSPFSTDVQVVDQNTVNAEGTNWSRTQ